MLNLGPLSEVVARTRARMRLQRAIEAATAGAALLFAAGGVVRIVQRLGYARAENEPPWLLALALLGAVAAALWPVTRESAAERLDRAHALHDRARTALDFAARSERTAFMDAAVRDAVARAASLSPRRAAPFRPPRARHVAWVCAVMWGLAGLAPARSGTPPPRSGRATRASVMSRDELAGFREELAALEATRTLSAEAERDVSTYRAVLDQVVRGELDRVQAIEALLALEKRLLPGATGDPTADRAALSELAKDLAPADDALSRALEQQDSATAAAALQSLAKALPSLPEAERARVKSALQRVQKREAAREAARKRETELEGLLKQREEQKAGPEEKRLLDRDRRELDRLRRENQASRDRSRELDKLERDLAEAAAQLGTDGLDAAERALGRGAEDLKRHAEKQDTREQREALAKQLAQLREMLQRKRDAKGGDTPQGKPPEPGEHEKRAQRFVMRAAGEDPDAEKDAVLSAKPGKGAPEGEPEQTGGEPGVRESENGKPALELGGATPGPVEMQLADSVQVVTGSRPTGAGEHDARTLRNATDIQGELRDSQVRGVVSKGPTRSEVILDAADRGFATASYRKVYSDYRTHAEEVLEKEDIPGGYRFYVRRYFQLIRPREERKAP